MKNLPLLAGVLFLLVGGFLIWQNTFISKESLNIESFLYQNSMMGFKAEIPKGWRVVSEKSENNLQHLTLESPDFQTTTVQAEENGDTYDAEIVVKGSKISINITSSDNFADTDIRTPEGYTRLYYDVYADSESYLDVEIVTLGGKPALVHRTIYELFNQQHPLDEDLQISTMHNRKPLNIYFSYDTYSVEQKAIINHFVETFQFI